MMLACVFCFSACGDDYDDYYDDYPQGRMDENTSLASASINSSANTTQVNDGTGSMVDMVIRQPQATIKGNGEDKITIFVYMNGSDLESDGQEATTDLKEMIAAGGSEKVDILVQTMGTKKWAKDLGIASNKSQRYLIDENGFNLVDDSLSQLDCTASSTLENFIKLGVKNYPADIYFLIFWNHGGGPVYGFGNDEFQGEYDALTLDEIQSALKNAGVYFDFVGMDCCIMSCMEVGCALYDHCDYMILSEDFESGYGWSYTPWLKKLYANTSMTVPELGRDIVDSMIDDNKGVNEEGILAVVDEGAMKVLYTSWVNFAYANEDSLIGENYSQKRTRSLGGRVSPILIKKGFFSSWLYGEEEEVTMSDYYITDIMAIAQNIDSDESKALSAAVARALVYVGTTDGDATLTGISITLPYGDSEFYSDLESIFTNCGIDSEYIQWLEKFVSASGYDSFYDYDDWGDEWSGWDDYDYGYDDYDDEDSWFDFFFGDYYDDYDDSCDWGWSDYDDDYWYDDDYYYDDGSYDNWYDDWYYYDDYGCGW